MPGELAAGLGWGHTGQWVTTRQAGPGPVWDQPLPPEPLTGWLLRKDGKGLWSDRPPRLRGQARGLSARCCPGKAVCTPCFPLTHVHSRDRDSSTQKGHLFVFL